MLPCTRSLAGSGHEVRMTRIFIMKLDAIQPSQLFISAEKLSQVMRDFDPLTPESLPPIPVKELGDKVVLTDGHTRALAAFLNGLSEIRVFWDEDELDWEAYETCVKWCEREGIHTVADLSNRIVPSAEYEELWLRRCSQLERSDTEEDTR